MCKLIDPPIFNMVNITNDKIKEISQNLYAGMRSFYNKETGDIKILPDNQSDMYLDQDTWADDIEEIDSEFKKYIVFEVMPSFESFKIMEGFIEEIDNKKLQNRLINALNRSKPFRNFKYEIDNSGEYRQMWFDFKGQKYFEWVKDQVDAMNFTVEENEK